MSKFIPQRKNANKHSLHGTRLLAESVQRDGLLFPRLVSYDGANLKARYVEQLREFSIPQLSLTVYLSNLINLLFCKFGSTAFFSCGLSAFCVSINHVFGVRSKPQMRRIYTKSIVTSMTNKFTLRYFSVMQYVRNAMSKHKLSIYSYRPVSSRITGSRPLPASIRLIDVAPKCINLFSSEHSLPFSGGCIVS